MCLWQGKLSQNGSFQSSIRRFYSVCSISSRRYGAKLSKAPTKWRRKEVVLEILFSFPRPSFNDLFVPSPLFNSSLSNDDSDVFLGMMGYASWAGICA